jgi:hypothetical protein
MHVCICTHTQAYGQYMHIHVCAHICRHTRTLVLKHTCMHTPEYVRAHACTLRRIKVRAIRSGGETNGSAGVTLLPPLSPPSDPQLRYGIALTTQKWRSCFAAHQINRFVKTILWKWRFRDIRNIDYMRVSLVKETSELHNYWFYYGLPWSNQCLWWLPVWLQTPETHDSSRTSSIKSMFVMIAGVAANARNAWFVKDVLDKINVCDDCRCGCIRPTRMIIEGCPW